MNLMGLTEGRAPPGVIQERLLRHFDHVDVDEASRDGWFVMRCIQGWGEDARLRLRVNFIWAAAGNGGWSYQILPGDRA